MKNPALLLIALAVVLVGAAVATFLLPPSSSTGPSTSQEPPSDPAAGFGGVGGGAVGSLPTAGHNGQEGHDAGLSSIDSGEGAPIDPGQGAPAPLALPGAPSTPSAAAHVPPSVTFAEPRTVEDEYDSASMVWSMVEARRESVRAELEEARRTGDQELSARLAHQLTLLDIGDHRLEGIVHGLETQRSQPTSPDEGFEGAAPEEVPAQQP